MMAAKELDQDIVPMVHVVAGTGRTAVGVLQVLEKLPHKKVTVAELPTLPQDPTIIYICQIDSKDVMEDEAGGFDKADYKSNPGRYRCTFEERVLPYTSCLYQCIYW